MARKQFVLVLSMILAITLMSVSPVLAAQKKEIRIAWWGSQNRHDRTIKVIQMYMAAHPDINMTWDFANFNDYFVKRNTEAAGGDLPCIMQQDYAYVSEWATRGLLLPLDDYIKDGTIDTKNIADASLKGGRVNDKLYAVNLGNNSQSFLIDTDLVKKAGLDMPSPTWTWADFEKMAMALHDKLGIWAIGIGDGLDNNQLWKSLYLGLGQWSFNDDGTALGYTDDKPLIDYFNMILRLQKAGAIASHERSSEFVKAGVEGQPIVKGDAVMSYLWSNQVVAVWKAAGADRHFKLWLLPRSEGGKSENYIKPSQFFSITAKCEFPKESADFINFFTNSNDANDILFAERGIPISSTVREHLLPKLDPGSAETFDFLSRVEKDNSPIRPADPPGANDLFNNVYEPQFAGPVLYGQLSVEDGVKTLRDQATEILAKNKKS